MKTWNTPDHHIHTPEVEHGMLHFADGTKTAIADWEITEHAPTPDGAIYKTLRGWCANTTGSGHLDDRFKIPFPEGRARLALGDLRGQTTIANLDVYCDIRSVGKPHPNTWDHPGYMINMTWKQWQITPAQRET